jgi:hypothetical protein
MRGRIGEGEKRRKGEGEKRLRGEGEKLRVTQRKLSETPWLNKT